MRDRQRFRDIKRDRERGRDRISVREREREREGDDKERKRDVVDLPESTRNFNIAGTWFEGLIYLGNLLEVNSYVNENLLKLFFT